METAGQAVGRMEIVAEAAGRTVAAEHRMGCEEVDRIVAEGAVRKAKEAARGHRKVKELALVVHRRARAREPVRVVRRATGLVQAVHRANELVRAVRKAIDWAEEDQKAELVEKVPRLLRSRSRMHLSCQSGPRFAGWCPWACRPLAYRHR